MVLKAEWVTGLMYRTNKPCISTLFTWPPPSLLGHWIAGQWGSIGSCLVAMVAHRKFLGPHLIFNEVFLFSSFLLQMKLSCLQSIYCLPAPQIQHSWYNFSVDLNKVNMFMLKCTYRMDCSKFMERQKLRNTRYMACSAAPELSSSSKNLTGSQSANYSCMSLDTLDIAVTVFCSSSRTSITFLW